MSDTLPGTTHPDDNNDRPTGLPCTVTPCFGARLVQEVIPVALPLQTAPVSEAGSATRMRTIWTGAFPLLMKQLELMLTSGELNPRHQHTVTLYAKG